MTNDPNHTANQYAVARLLVPVLIEAGAADANVDVDDFIDLTWRIAVLEAARRDVQRYHREVDTASATVSIGNLQGALDGIPKPWNPKPGYIPSESTKRLVAAMIRAETAPTPTTDPFAGLGTGTDYLYEPTAERDRMGPR